MLYRVVAVELFWAPGFVAGWEVGRRHPDDVFVVNIGDLMSLYPGSLTPKNCADLKAVRITNGLYKSTVHRVLSSPRERLSIPFFFSINYDATVEAIASCVSDERRPNIRLSLRESMCSSGCG